MARRNPLEPAPHRRRRRSTPADYALILVGVLMEVNALFLLRAALDFRGGNRFELVFAYGALMLAVSCSCCIARKRGDLAVTIRPRSPLRVTASPCRSGRVSRRGQLDRVRPVDGVERLPVRRTWCAERVRRCSASSRTVEPAVRRWAPGPDIASSTCSSSPAVIAGPGQTESRRSGGAQPVGLEISAPWRGFLIVGGRRQPAQ